MPRHRLLDHEGWYAVAGALPSKSASSSRTLEFVSAILLQPCHGPPGYALGRLLARTAPGTLHVLIDHSYLYKHLYKIVVICLLRHAVKSAQSLGLTPHHSAPRRSLHHAQAPLLHLHGCRSIRQKLLRQTKLVVRR